MPAVVRERAAVFKHALHTLPGVIPERRLVGKTVDGTVSGIPDLQLPGVRDVGGTAVADGDAVQDKRRSLTANRSVALYRLIESKGGVGRVKFTFGVIVDRTAGSRFVPVERRIDGHKGRSAVIVDRTAGMAAAIHSVVGKKAVRDRQISTPAAFLVEDRSAAAGCIE